jgi:conserved oligomeric Golgi complex subunit 6
LIKDIKRNTQQVNMSDIKSKSSSPLPQNEASKVTAVNPISRKLNKILESKIENDKDLLEALRTLSGFFPENSMRSRRNLRSDIEKRSLILNEDFLNAFRTIKEQLDTICDSIDSMAQCSNNMMSRLEDVKLQTNELITQTNKLQNEKVDVDKKLEIAKRFIEKFQLTNDEINHLCGQINNDYQDNTTTTIQLHPQFFTALHRVRTIHNNCKILLRTNQQTAGLEIMEQMAIHQEAAYERLYRYMQNECRKFCSTDQVEICDFMSTGLFVIAYRSILFKYIIDEYNNSRRNAIVKLFIDALTKGGPNGNPKPIELNSHDPLRYIGDMLAWIHQTTASENEFLASLYRKFRNTNELEEKIKTSLGFIMDGVCRLLKIRVEQVLVSQKDTTLYKISNLIKFYNHTIESKVVNCELTETLSEMHQLSYRMFLNSLTVHSTRLLDKIEPPNKDLMPNDEFRRTLNLIKDIFDSYNNSVVTISSKKDEYNQILDCVIEPMLQMSSLSAIHLSQIDMAVYMVNCIYTIHSLLSLYEYTDKKLEKLEAQVSDKFNFNPFFNRNSILNCFFLRLMLI